MKRLQRIHRVFILKGSNQTLQDYLRKQRMVLTISNDTNFVKTLIAARSTSRSFGRMVRKRARCLAADAAAEVTLNKVEDGFGCVMPECFQPDCMTVDRACDAEFTERMADILRSPSETTAGAFCFPFVLDMVRPEASFSANWSVDTAVFFGLVGWRVEFARRVVAMSVTRKALQRCSF
jgi:hypothetical protein